MNWGKKIILAYAFFMTLVITMVVISMKEDVNLVAADYYVQEIAYQDQMDRIENHLDTKEMSVDFDRAGHKVTLIYEGSSAISGEVLFFRPSDSAKDRRVKLDLSKENKQIFDTSGMRSGLWKIKVSWQKGSDEYYHEQVIII